MSGKRLGRHEWGETAVLFRIAPNAPDYRTRLDIISIIASRSHHKTHPKTQLQPPHQTLFSPIAQNCLTHV
jgi:hypothetical protein